MYMISLVKDTKLRPEDSDLGVKPETIWFECNFWKEVSFNLSVVITDFFKVALLSWIFNGISEYLKMQFF